MRNARNRHFEKVFVRAGTRSDVVWREVNKVLLPDCHRQQELELTIGSNVVGGEELANTFNKHFTSLNSSTHDINATSFLGSPNRHTAVFEPVTANEVCKTFMSLKNSTSRDINGLQIRPIKYVLDLVVEVLTHIFNICLSNGVFPEKMQHAKVIVLFKSGNTNELTNHRPVSVLPIISKGREKVICERITTFCDKHNILSGTQYGFRSGMSTELALLSQKELTLNNFENKILTLGIFIDFSKAFDSTNYETLFSKLEHYGFPGITLKLIKSYLQHRKHCVAIGSKLSSARSLTQGVPQGSVLGPVLFNLYINDITNITKLAQFVVYADDTSLFFQSPDIVHLVNVANTSLSILQKWSDLNSLPINTKKTKAVLFTPPQKHVNCSSALYLGADKIELVDDVKTLGVIFNNHLNWAVMLNVLRLN